MVSLWTSCPKMQVNGPNPNFSRLIHGVLAQVGCVILASVELSHYVVLVFYDYFVANRLQ
jgi:hypothetical protein